MEFCGGGALDSMYRALKKPLTEDQLAVILHESIAGLEYLHNTAGIIHRDIKAGNLLLTEDGCLKLGMNYIDLVENSILNLTLDYLYIKPTLEFPRDLSLWMDERELSLELRKSMNRGVLCWQSRNGLCLFIWCT